MNFLDYPIAPSEEAIKEFRALIKEKYGVEYSDRQAREGAYNLINFFRILLVIDKKNQSRAKLVGVLNGIARKKSV